MELMLIEKTNQTRIKVSIKQLSLYSSIIMGYISIYGGYEDHRTSKYVYYIIDANILSIGK